MNIGIELGIIKTDLDPIKVTEGGNPGNCLREMLALWLKQVHPPPTWSALITALKQPTIGLQQLAKEIEKKYKCLTGLSTEVAMPSFPYIKEVAPDDHALEELEYRLRMESKDIIMQFRILRNKFFDSIEKQAITVKKLKRYLEEDLDDASQQQIVTKTLTTVDDVEEFIKNNTSFFDYQLIKYLIELTGTDEDKDQLKQYEEAFSAYAKRRVFECPSTFDGSNDDTKSELHVKLDSAYDKYKLEELKELKYRLCSILRISLYGFHLKVVKKGCLLVIFTISSHIEGDIFPLSAEQEKALIELRVLWLICGDYHFQRHKDQV